jgi:putative ABC transport system permease protein
MVSVNTGEILAVANGVGESTRTGTNLIGSGGGAGSAAAGMLDMTSSNFANTVLGEAVNAATQKLATELDANASRLPTTTVSLNGLVADVSGNSLVLNIGSKAGVKVGDKLTVNVLGRDIEGTIANLRDVDFTTGQQNFVLVMSPGVVDQAPHTFLATVIVSNAEEPAMYRAVTDRFPNISTVRVKDAIAQVDAILNQLGDGVRAASLLTIFAGLLVLAGAIAAGSRARLYDSTILKVLGATRARIAAVYALEYGLLGVLTGIVAFGLGAVASSFIAENMLQINFVFDVKAAFLTIFGGGVATLAFGLAGAITALAAKPTRQLRAP